MLSTGIGSWPGVEAKAAVLRILREHPRLPYWPQLPALGREESMLWQFVPPLRPASGAEAWEGRTGLEAAELAEWLAGDEAPVDAAPGLEELLRCAGRPERAKGQSTGPVTLALNLKSARGVPLAGFPELRRLLRQSLLRAALRQAQRLASVSSRVLLVFDEPALFAEGAEALDEDLAWCARGVRQAGFEVGVHTCGPPPWARLARLPLDFLSFDAWRYPPPADSAIPWERLAWGLVPCTADAPDVPELRRRLPEPPPAVLTPACGFAFLEPRAVEQVLQRLAALTA